MTTTQSGTVRTTDGEATAVKNVAAQGGGKHNAKRRHRYSGRSHAATAAELPPPPPVSSKAKDYSDRPLETLDELDDLRKRGTAKLLNKHFTNTIQQVAQQQAQAEQALRELEQRKAHNSAAANASPTKNNTAPGVTFNPYDAMYLQLKETQKQCRRKEKETLLLYQRYVAKYGDTGLVAVPSLQAAKKRRKSNKVLYAGSRAVVLDDNEQRPTRADVKASTIHESNNEHDSDSEDIELTQDTLKNKQDLNFKSYYKKLYANRSRTNADSHQHTDNDDRKSHSNVSFEAQEQSDADQSHTAVVTPSKTVNPSKSVDDNGTTAIVRPPPTPQLHSLSDTMLETPVKNTPSMPTVTVLNISSNNDKNHDDGGDEVDDDPKSLFLPGNLSVMTSSRPTQATTDMMTRERSDSLDELTPVKSNKAIDAVASLLLNSDSDEDLDFDDIVGDTDFRRPIVESIPPSKQGILPSSSNEVPSAATTENDDDGENVELIFVQHLDEDGNEISDDHDLSSIISGLTSVHSGLTKQQFLEDLESQLEDFIKTETENIRKIMDDNSFTDNKNDGSNSDSPDHSFDHLSSNSDSLFGAESSRATLQAEKMAQQMQQMLDDFGKDMEKPREDSEESVGTDAGVDTGGASIKSSRTGTDTASLQECAQKKQQQSDVASLASSKLGYPRKYHTDNPEEDWTVHWDDKHRREYFFENNTKRSVWQAPASITFNATADQSMLTMSDADDRSIYSLRSAALTHATQITHEDVSPADDRSLVSASRRKSYRKRVRRRRRRQIRIAAMLLLLLCGLTVYWRMQSPELTAKLWVNQQVTTIKDFIEYQFTDRAERELQELEMKLEEERRQTERERQLTLRAQEEAKRAEEVHRAKIIAELLAREEAATRERVEKQQKNFQALLRAIAERKLEIEEKQNSWNCRLPFSKRFNPRCGGKATLKQLSNNGAFDESSSFRASPSVVGTQMAQYFLE